jgi:hypothetical protein
MRAGKTSFFFAAIAAALFLIACGGGDDDGNDVDARRIDAASIDATDTDGPDIDAPDVDAAVDAPTDANIDAPIDATPTASGWIQLARQAPDGASQTLPIMGATVTYLKPAIGNDPAGFTIQAEQMGPALMVAVDPASLTPAPVVGDVVSFTITTMTTVSGQRRATAVTDFTRDSQGFDVDPLAQDVNAATDLVSAIDSYESEILDLSGTITTNFVFAGSGFESAQITTAGMTTSDPTFLLRVPATLRSDDDMVMGCQFTLDHTPIQKFVTTSNPPQTLAQTSAFVPEDISLSNCPAPIAMAAVALSPTSVRITFSRNILASSVNVDGTQFTIDNGLDVVDATVSGRTVTLTTTAQTGGTLYTVTVANTVTDLQGTMLGTPSSTMFAGFLTPAVVRINEINAHISGSCDLVELRVISGGNMANFKLQERTGVNNASTTELNFTFTNFNVLTNDIIVVHLNGANATCNPGTPQAVNETTSVTQQPASMFARNFDGAYDWYTGAGDNGLTDTDNVITLYDAAGTIMDCVLVDDDALPTTMQPSNVAANSETQAAACAAAGQWHNNGGGTPAGGYVDEDFRMNAVRDSDGTSTTFNSGNTLQRIDDTDDDEMADWNASPGVAQTFGAPNAGQSTLP